MEDRNLKIKSGKINDAQLDLIVAHNAIVTITRFLHRRTVQISGFLIAKRGKNNTQTQLHQQNKFINDEIIFLSLDDDGWAELLTRKKKPAAQTKQDLWKKKHTASRREKDEVG